MWHSNAFFFVIIIGIQVVLFVLLEFIEMKKMRFNPYI